MYKTTTISRALANVIAVLTAGDPLTCHVAPDFSDGGRGLPIEFAKVALVNNPKEMAGAPSVAAADAILLYGAGSGLSGAQDFGNGVIIFQRHRSGPLYLQYEVISPRFFASAYGSAFFRHITIDDVVTGRLDELIGGFALCGLKNTPNANVICFGGMGTWAQPEGVVIPELVKKVWNLDLVPVAHDALGALIGQARSDVIAVVVARRRADARPASAGTTLQTRREFVDNCLLLDQVFRALMADANCQTFTIKGHMSTIVPKAQTSACLMPSTLNDDGYLAFCESDFAVIPSGLLWANISGKPVFLNDPTCPRDGIHCAEPLHRPMQDVWTANAAREDRHAFRIESRRHAKVRVAEGAGVDQHRARYQVRAVDGIARQVTGSPFLPICRDQIEMV